VICYFFSENRTNISFEQIPLHLHNALIATEDVRFYNHKGIDVRSLARVFIKTILISDRSSGGGSTITQQLAKNMFGRTKTGFPAILVHKAKEAIIANRIEKLFTKEEILTLYLNTVSFGENVFGISRSTAIPARPTSRSAPCGRPARIAAAAISTTGSRPAPTRRGSRR
jgi:penicillin-binding protein 1A